jgi:hypothetical protein
MERSAKRLLMSTPGFNLRSTCSVHHPLCVNAHPFSVNAGLVHGPPITPSQRVRSDGRQSPRRAPNRLGYKEIRRHHPPVPHQEIWGEPPDPRPLPTHYPTTSVMSWPRSATPLCTSSPNSSFTWTAPISRLWFSYSQTTPSLSCCRRATSYTGSDADVFLFTATPTPSVEPGRRERTATPRPRWPRRAPRAACCGGCWPAGGPPR